MSCYNSHEKCKAPEKNNNGSCITESEEDEGKPNYHHQGKYLLRDETHKTVILDRIVHKQIPFEV